MRRFSILLIIRVILLVVTISTLAFIFGDERLFFNHIILGTVIVLQVAELIRFINHTNRELARLFLSIRHADFSITFNQGYRDKSFRELRDSLANIIRMYKEVKIEKEAQFHFLQMLVTQVQVGIISLENETDIALINPVAEQLLNIRGIRNWRFIQQFHPAFVSAVEQLGDNGKKLVELKLKEETRLLSVDVHTLNILDRSQRLITFQDINAEIEQKEIEAWHKLIRILTHEIMNSVTPISSLTETMQSMLEDREGKQKELKDLQNDTISDIRFSLKTIQKRSDGLLNFVDAYRKFTRVPRPVTEQVDLEDLFMSVEELMRSELHQQGIQLTISIAEGVSSAELDRTLIEQVLINMITNSIHALSGRPEPAIRLLAYHDGHGLVIEITDNGIGIGEKELSEIFIPFFSTKKEGSGIGLSLSKQIVTSHGGNIRVRSELNNGTSFYLRFRSTH